MTFRPSRSMARTSTLVLAESPSFVERGAAALPFLFPFCDGFSYGAYIYKNVPIVGDAAYTVAPLVMAFEGLPFVGLILFLGLSYFSRNLGLSRFVRFSIQQALILDIALLIPSFLGGLGRMFPFEMQVMGNNFVFYIMALTVSYSWVMIAQGKTPDQVPIISDAANAQIGPM